MESHGDTNIQQRRSCLQCGGMYSVLGHVMDGVCDGQRLSQRLSRAEGVTEVWLFGEDSFEECPLTDLGAMELGLSLITTSAE